jgi:sortase A
MRPSKHRPRIATLVLLLVIAGGCSSAGSPTPAPVPPPTESAVSGPSFTAAASPPPEPSGSPASDQSPSAGPGVVATGIAIPALGIDMPIYQGDGVTVKLGKVAHYPSSAWPRAGSLIYLYAHAREHNFLALWRAKIGEQVRLRLADGSTAIYVISRIDTKVRWNDLSWLDPTPTEVLRLQTCNSYQETAPRFIVEARPVVEASPMPSSTITP